MRKLKTLLCSAKLSSYPNACAVIKKRDLVTFVLIVSLLVSVHFIGGIGCLVAPTESDDLIATAREEIANNVSRLYEQRSEKPNQLPPLNIDLNNVQSQVIKLGRGGTGGHGGGVGGGGVGGGGGGGG